MRQQHYVAHETAAVAKNKPTIRAIEQIFDFSLFFQMKEKIERYRWAEGKQSVNKCNITKEEERKSTEK